MHYPRRLVSIYIFLHLIAEIFGGDYPFFRIEHTHNFLLAQKHVKISYRKYI